MTYWLSNPIESLFHDPAVTVTDPAPGNAPVVTPDDPIDYLVIGSGYGAAMAALALLERRDALDERPRVWIFERGDEYVPDDFPRTLDDLPSYLNYVSGETFGNRVDNVQNRSGLWELRSGDDVLVLTGSGLGGTSLVNANVASRPGSEVLQSWPQPEFSARDWTQLFSDVYPKIEALLGVRLTPDADAIPKYDALENTADCLSAGIEVAPVSINFDGAGPHSVNTDPCNRCGNCVIGCHSGAKQSLHMNAWPLVSQMGGNRVRLFTGVSARTVHRDDTALTPWIVSSALTRDPDRRFEIPARHVILAAGTLGSAEILMRSRAQRGLTLSDRLGRRFSTNGDALISVAGRRQPVEAVCDMPTRPNPHPHPGPTIVGRAEVNLDNPDAPDETFTLEDGAVPYPLLQLWQELLVTQSFLRRYESDRLSAWHDSHPLHDYLAVSSDLNRHSQVLLAMGDDRALGDIEFDNDTALPRWPMNSGEFDFFEALDARLKAAEEFCFDGGQYHPNILWQPVPPGFAQAVSGAENLPSQLLSVHPLGGCCMGATAATGVVNTRGQVFDGPAGTGVHDGLYVLDGAIIPGAIGTNPFMTIAATSYVLGYQLARQDWPDGPFMMDRFPALDTTDPEMRLPDGSPHPTPDDAALEVGGVFRERLVHYLGRTTLLPWSVESEVSLADINRLFELRGEDLPADTKALVLDVEFDLGGDKHLGNWLQKPGVDLEARATLSYDRSFRVLTVAGDNLVPIAHLRGTVNLGIIDRPFWRCWRLVFHVFLRFLRYRKSELLGGGVGGLRERVRGIFRVGRLHTDFRRMEYRFEQDMTVAAAPPLNLVIQGIKTIGYSNRYRNFWASILSMDGQMAADRSWGRSNIEFDWELDSVDITDGRAPFQVRNSLRLLNLLSRAIGAAAYFVRVALQTHFWSFGAPDYDRYRSAEHMDAAIPVTPPLEPSLSRMVSPPDRIRYGPGNSLVSTAVEVALHPDTVVDQQLCRLLRYQPGSDDDIATRKTLLLIHGLAHGSRIFWSDTLETNFVQYFLERNYDIWIIDHRTSPNFVRAVEPIHRWDDIALDDVPWAVRHVYEVINAGNFGPMRQIHVFSHCIGAGAVSIAALEGELNDPVSGQSMLRSLVPHAVAPWLFASMANRTRTNLWGSVMNIEPFAVVDPRPHRDTPLIESLLDRIATSTLYPPEHFQWDQCAIYRDARGPMFPRSIYARYTIIWGRQWVNDNISHATRNRFAGMIGAVPRDVLQQVYASITRGLLSDHDSNNVYVTRDNIDNNWTFPTLFIHGDRNTVFDIETSRRSAEMLTRHRRVPPPGDDFYGDIGPADYCNNDVWIETLPGYGHMDMILGKNVHVDADPGAEPGVFQRLHRFFDAAEHNRVPAEYAGDFTTPDELARFTAERRAGSRIEPTRIPLVGPIISRPALVSDGDGTPMLEVVLWVEAQDFSSNPVEEIYLETSSEAAIRLLAIGVGPAPMARRSFSPPPILSVHAAPPLAAPVGEVFRRLIGPGHSLPQPPPLPIFVPWKEFEFTTDSGIKLETLFAARDIHNLPSLNPFAFRNPGEIYMLKKVALPLQSNIRLQFSIDADADEGDLPTSELEPVHYLWLDHAGGSERPDNAIEMRWNGLDWLDRIVSMWVVPEGDPALCFVIGSCLYPGTALDVEQMGEIYGGIFRHVLRQVPDSTNPGDYRRGVDHIMLLGDQIYADATAGLADPIIPYERYREKYRRAWSSPAARLLFSHVPTYFSVDDHEYDNDYQGDPGDPEDFIYARNMAWMYQIHDREALQQVVNGAAPVDPAPRLWYQFTSADFRFFVLDTRFERNAQPGRGNVLSLMQDIQLGEFGAWLDGAPDGGTVFIASGSPLAPVTREQRSHPYLLDGGDSLLSYPGFLHWLIDRLSQIPGNPHICWLTGDPHLSCYAGLEFVTAAASIRMTQVCASGAYAPLSFINTNPNACDWNDSAEDPAIAPARRLDLAPGLHLNYRQFLVSAHPQHFVRIDLNAAAPDPELTISAYDASGRDDRRLFDPDPIALPRMR